MLTIAARLAHLVAQLRQAIATQLHRQARALQPVMLGTQLFVPIIAPPRLPPLPAETWTLLWHRLGRTASRFQTLFARWQANRLPPHRPTRAPRKTSVTATTARPRLPRTHGWVNHRIPESAPPSGQLEALLHDPETRAFVAAAPQAGRLLRPLCRALGLPQPAWLRLPARPRPPRRATPPPVQGDADTAPAPTPDRPIPAYVLAAARAWKRKYR